MYPVVPTSSVGENPSGADNQQERRSIMKFKLMVILVALGAICIIMNPPPSNLFFRAMVP